MWTPKRFLIYVLGLVGFMAAFAVAYFLLPYDGLPPLPPHLVYDGNGGVGPFNPTDVVPEGDLKIRQAFGNECEELNRQSKVWLPSKGAVLTINNFEIQKDGRVKLSPFSIGLFAKSKDGKQFPEINTIQCEYAMLTLDRPATSLTELGSRKVVGVELGGERGVKLTNNRKSQEKSDDLEMYVTEGKLFYEDARNLIWSNGYVKVLDTQSKPLPTEITAVGMEIVLNKDISPNRNKKAEPAKKAEGKAAGVNGVEMIRLLANVDMHLHTDARSGFMAGPDELAKKPAAKGAPEEKAHVHIKTNGKFVFDLVKDTARFDAPEQASLAHDRVTVTRHLAAKAPKTGMVTDLLECDRLDLQFRKKVPGAVTTVSNATTAPAKSATDTSGDKDIDFAIATAKPDAIVELHLEGEEMHAWGVEMRYFAANTTSGPRTILKGSPMHAVRQGHQIRAEELHLKGADKQGNGQEAFAKGPGKIDLLDKKLGRSTTHILFKNSFTATKDKDGDRIYDLITIRGDASVIDEEHKQEMHAAQFLHVWLEEIKRDPAPAVAGTLTSSSAPVGEPRLPDVITPSITIGVPKKDEPKSDLAAAGQKNRLHKIEAFEKVQVRSPELNIRDANHLTICFREQKIVVPPKTFDGVQALPAIGPAPGAGPKVDNDKKPGEPGLPVAGAPKEEKDKEKVKEKVRRPLEMTASEITAYVATMGNTKELLEFVAEGNVHVSQAAENPKDKGLDIVGNMLSLVRKTGGDILYVFGEPRKLAQLQHNEVLLFGPKVTIDQVENIANVEGTGAMHMPSNTSLDGKKQEGHLTIHWNKSMWFNGRSADFDGGVEAFQGNGKIRCQQMQVTFDKPVNFKQTKGSQSSKVDKILCNGQGDQRVYILEEDRDKSNKIVTYRRLLLAVVEVDNLEQRLNGSGPGVLDFIGQASASDPGLGPKDGPKEAAKKDDDKILKWTRVRFEGQMISYPTAGGGRQTTFLDQVRVYHQPGEDPNVRDPQAVGPGGLFFTCQRLTLVQRKIGGKNSQEMIADGMNGMVNFQGQDFHGNAKTVKYDENQEQIIFEGVPGAPATLFKRPAIQGAQPQRLQGSKILYNRKTGEFLLDGVRVISSWLLPEEPRPYELASLDHWVARPEVLRRAW